MCCLECRVCYLRSHITKFLREDATGLLLRSYTTLQHILDESLEVSPDENVTASPAKTLRDFHL